MIDTTNGVIGNEKRDKMENEVEVKWKRSQVDEYKNNLFDVYSQHKKRLITIHYIGL